MLDIDLATTGGALAIPLIIAIIQAFKMVGLTSKYAPLASIALGIVIAFMIDLGEPLAMGETILSGVVFGLSASGLYSGTMTTKKIVDQDPKHVE